MKMLTPTGAMEINASAVAMRGTLNVFANSLARFDNAMMGCLLIATATPIQTPLLHLLEWNRNNGPSVYGSVKINIIKLLIHAHRNLRRSAAGASPHCDCTTCTHNGAPLTQCVHASANRWSDDLHFALNA